MRTLAAPLERRVGAAAAPRLYALVDQGTSGLGNIIAFALLGRALTVTEFGAVGMMIGLHYVIAGFHRSAAVLPFTTDHRADHDPRAAHAENSDWWWIALALALALSAATALVGGAVAMAARRWPECGWAVEPLLLTALISPAMLGWEFARRWLYKIDRADMVALCATAYFLVLALAALMAGRLGLGAPGGALAWVLASLAALGLALPGLAPARADRAGVRALVRRHRAESSWLAATNLPYSVYSTASIVVVIGVLVGPVAAALFTAARTLTNPAMSIVSAIDSIDKPRAARAFAGEGLPGLARVVRRSRLTIAVATGLYLALVAVFAAPLVALVFHGQYDGSAANVRLLALGFFLFGLNLPSETLLIVRRAGRTMLAIRCVTAALTILGLWLGGRHGVAGMAIAFAVTQAFNLLLLRAAEARHARETFA
ncbi:hypothetical protein [Sphingomonas sp. BK580]|uniref:hypothetical protein n=1 Tax=Sphingomonas sp. BK580 TaxID=2586972 RepID=UPI001607C3B4|nr:hypothetical protein [Sphingomonas sp. BK580]MBB3695757.1 O-antigen/teichoic acid export membrane protein [Sphingomonas sp. BK580]